jgi:hypothetical protein
VTCFKPNIVKKVVTENLYTGERFKNEIKTQFIGYKTVEKLGLEYFTKENIKEYENAYVGNYEGKPCRIYNEYIKIPCTKCYGCRIDSSKQWATRCVLEANEWKENWFITLTYDDDHLPPKKIINYQGEEYLFEHYLEPEDLTVFNNSLRRHWLRKYGHDNIRFFACGEYGELYGRPHFHGIYFNLPIPPNELRWWKNTSDGNQLFTCDEIEKIWGKGMVRIGHVTWSTCAYTARYIMKKFKGPEAEHHYCQIGKTPEFTRMSRMPGIARNWYEQNKNKIYDLDEIIMKTTGEKVHAIKPPKYYDKLYDIEYPERMQEIKEIRKNNMIQKQKVKNLTTTMPELEQLKVEESSLRERTKILTRDRLEEKRRKAR